VFLKKLVFGEGWTDQTDQRVANIVGIQTFAAEKRLFKRENAEQAAECTAHGSDSPLSPGPNLGGDEVDDGDARQGQAPRDAQVKIRRIREDGDMRAQFPSGSQQLAIFPIDAGNVQDHLGQSDDRQAGGVDYGADTGGAQPRSGTTEEFGAGRRKTHLLDHQRRVKVARGFAGGNQDAGGHSTLRYQEGPAAGTFMGRRIRSRGVLQPSMNMIDLKALAAFDTPTVSNTIELFEVRPRNQGYMDGRIRACFPEMPAICGYAATATMRCDAPRREGDVYGSLDQQVTRFAELPGTPIVVFQDLDDPPMSATFGEIMCSTYQAFGAAGIVTSGAARDLDQVRRMGFPAFSNGAICSHGYSHIVDLCGTVRVGGLTIRPGDLLHADANGVTTVPLEIAGEIPEAAAEFARAESIVLDYLRSGPPQVNLFAEARREMMDQIAALGKRLRAGR